MAAKTELQTEQRLELDDLQALLEAMPVVIQICDEQARVITWNAASERLTGVKREDVLGKSMAEVSARFVPVELRTPDYVARMDENIRKSLAAGELLFPSYGNFTLVPTTGPPRFVQQVNFVYRTRGHMRLAAALIDVTVEKEAERHLVAWDEQLQRVQKLESIGRLAGAVAHEFNNFLTGIMGNVSLAQRDVPPEHPLAQHLADIQYASQSAATLTADLLAFSHKQVVAPRVLDVNAFLGQLEGPLKRVVGEAVELRTSFAPGLAPVRIDPSQLELIVVNLCVNARDAMPEGGVLTLTTRSVKLGEQDFSTLPAAQPGSFIACAVSDTGIGISNEVKARLFEPFFTTKEQGRGTGLGLATVYGAVGQNGGHLTVQSELGRGTTFEVRLPQIDTVSEALSPPTPVEAPHGMETIFVVEDDHLVRKLAVRALERLGYHVCGFSSGQASLEAMTQQATKVDLLLTDVVMPEMNGKQLAEEMRAVCPTLRVLFTSGYSDHVIAEHGAFQARTAFLPKPYSTSMLAQKVREILDA